MRKCGHWGRGIQGNVSRKLSLSCILYFDSCELWEPKFGLKEEPEWYKFHKMFETMEHKWTIWWDTRREVPGLQIAHSLNSCSYFRNCVQKKQETLLWHPFREKNDSLQSYRVTPVTGAQSAFICKFQNCCGLIGTSTFWLHFSLLWKEPVSLHFHASFSFLALHNFPVGINILAMLLLYQLHRNGL